MNSRLYEKVRWLEKGEGATLLLLALLVFVCFFFRLGSVPLLGKDEPRYAEVAREMVVTGDWITPRLAGHTWFEKPALPYWLMAAGFTVFGVTEFAARFGSAILAALAVAAVYLAARRAWGVAAARYSAAALATSGLWFAFARAASFDMPLAATVAAALGSLYALDVARGRAARLAWAVSFGAWVGAAMLAKGLVGPLLLGLVTIPYLTVTGGWRRLRVGELAAATAATLAVAATWYWPVYARNGWTFVDEFFVSHHFQRFFTNKFHHPAPWYFFVLIILAGILPWTFFLLANVPALGRTLRRRPGTDGERLVWLASLSVAVPLVFFSASTSKLPGYILPAFPGLALLVGWTLASFESEGRGRWALLATGLGMLGVGFGLAGYAAVSMRPDQLWEVVVLPAPLVIGALILRDEWKRRRYDRVAGAIATGMALTVVLITTLLFGELGARESLAALSEDADRELRPGEVLVPYLLTEYGPSFYTRGRVAVDEHGEILIASSVDDVVDVASAAPTRSALCLTTDTGMERLGTDSRISLESVSGETYGSEARRRLLLRVTVR
jgi:4-amino-4-deoxy-L-arabinose transferase-like glycosyltransferase